jgi:hypothetical protein
MATKKSGCSCGAVQVELQGDPNVQVYCHCSSCRGWLGAPIHAATLWPAANVLVGHPAIGMIDVPVGTIQGFAFKPTLHVHYGEKVLAVRDGLPKFKDFPKEFGGSGDTLAE